MTAEHSPGQRSELTILSRDFDPAPFELVEELNNLADTLRSKADLYNGIAIGGIAISSDASTAVFETIRHDPYIRQSLSLYNPFPIGGARGRTVEDNNVTVFTRREIRPFMLRGKMTNRMACDSFTYPLVADAKGFGYFARTEGLRTDNNDMVSEEISMRRTLAPLFIGSATQLLGRLLKLDEILTRKAP
jgi:hypothetical protein